MKAALIFCLLFLVGCIKNVDKHAFNVQLKNGQTPIEQLCLELNQMGTIQEHFKLIKWNSDKTFELFENDHLYIDQRQFNYLQDQVQYHIERVHQLLDDQYTTVLYDYEVQWRVDKEDLKKFLGHYLPGGFRITDVEFLKAVYWGEERSDYLDFISYDFGPKNIDISFQSQGSALEICQLQQTRIFLMKMDYEHLNRKKYRYYNLISRSSYEK